MRYVLAFGFRNQCDCEMFRHSVFLRVSVVVSLSVSKYGAPLSWRVSFSSSSYHLGDGFKPP